ncbi:hypothetical protein VKT23_019980 [Stygiomarasmius scandens]|uniref:Transposase n=1 Tax=Marasmiellus scandens TaxID=2682957 RepID=A0ABR1IK14_9AGAR
MFEQVSNLLKVLEKRFDGKLQKAFHIIRARKAISLNVPKRTPATKVRMICAIKNYMDQLSWRKDPNPEWTTFHEIISDDDMLSEYRLSECESHPYDELDSDGSVDSTWVDKTFGLEW